MVQYIVCTIYFALHSLAYLVQYCFVLILKNLRRDELMFLRLLWYFKDNCAPAYTHTTLMISKSNVKYDNFINPYFIYMLSLYLALALACMWLLITVHLYTQYHIIYCMHLLGKAAKKLNVGNTLKDISNF